MRGWGSLALGFVIASGGCSAQAPWQASQALSASAQDVVLDWNTAFTDAVKAPGTSPGDTSRLGAILHVAIYDAVNGIEGRYTPLHEDEAAPAGARSEAAAAQAGHDVLLALYPSRSAIFNALLDAELAGVAGSDGNSVSIARGRQWGSHVAADILAWRSADGRACNPAAPGTTCPNHFGQTGLGQWRPVPPQPSGAAAAAPQYVNMVPWVMTSHDQFLSTWQGPPAIDSPAFAADVAESEQLGSNPSAARTKAQTDVALFYADNANAHWNRIANTVAHEHPSSLAETARIFAALNVALADANINVWQSKYKFNFWRPYTAIRETTAYNPLVTPDPTYVSLVTTPGHQEYGSGHSHVSGAAAVVLASFYGDDVTVTHGSDTLSTSRTTTSFSQVADEIDDARVWGGIHWRTTVTESHTLGAALGQYVLDHAFLSASGNKGKTSHDHAAGDVVTGDVGDGE